MASPFFFEENLSSSDEFILGEETSRHIVQVLRMKENEEIILTNGNGQTKTAQIVFPDKKKTKVKVVHSEFNEPPKPKTAIAISLIKNNNRFEWFLEKAAEIGISAIIPMICKRTEKIHFRLERMKSILISAMLQSQQSWLPEISEPAKFSDVIKNEKFDQKFIAHCIDKEKNELKNVVEEYSSRIILIGPEGDFTEEEIENAIEQNYLPVSLGATRLRTETAGLVAAVFLV
ncbi:MAG TPA: RsmE family RNA methyltransferase [Hanamia sp.]|nr:RsmE family RNA methyltransferase [Hanamia sp.]